MPKIKRPSKKPFISLILVNYNGRKELKGCLPSLLKTNYPQNKLEIILVDNHSTDKSVDFVSKNFPEVKIIKSANEGYGAGANKGIRISSGEYAAILNIDLNFHPNWLIHLLEPLRENTTAAVSGPLLLPFDHPFPPKNIKLPSFSPLGFPYNHPLPYSPKPVETLWVSGAAMLIKKKLVEEIDYFDPLYFLYNEDLDLCFRTRMRGYKVFLAPKSVVRHRGSTLIDPTLTPPEKVFLNTQTSLITILKNYSNKNLLIYGLPTLTLRLADIINDFLHPSYRRFAKAKVRGIWSTFTKIDNILEKRRCTQKLRREPDSKIFELNQDNPLMIVIRQRITKHRQK